MKVKDLLGVIFDKVIIYKANNESFEDFENIYKGEMNDIPLDILEMEVRSIGASRKEVVDIQVF